MSKLVAFYLLVLLATTFLWCEAGRPTVVVVGKRNGGASQGGRRQGGMGDGYGSAYGKDGMDMAKSWNDIGQQYAKWPIGQAGG